MKHIFLFVGLIGILFIHFMVLKNITFTAWPEMFSYPYLVNNNYLIYRDFAHPYVPLLTSILAIYYKTAGMNLYTNQYFTWGLILLNDFLIFLISFKILKKGLVLVPIIVYVFLQPIFEGNMLWFDLATVPFILGFFAVFVYIKDLNRRLFFSGLLLALTLLIKQQAIILVGLISLAALFLKETRRSSYVLFLGLLIPLLVSYLLLNIFNVFNNYLFWTLEFPLRWLPRFSGYAQMPGTRDIIFLSVLFILPVVFTALNYKKINPFEKILSVSLLAALIMAFPRFSYFHLQPALAVLVILYASLMKNFKNAAPVFLIFPILAGLYLWKEYRPFIGVESARFYDNEELKFAKFIQDNTKIADKVYFIGPHSLLYSLSGRFPPKPWIENYVWHFEIPGLQERQIEGFEKERNLVIFKQGPSSGNWYDLGVYQPKEIIEYINGNFKMVNKSIDGVEVWKRKGD